MRVKMDATNMFFMTLKKWTQLLKNQELIKLKGLEKTIYPGESVEFDLKINKNKIISKGQLAIILDYGHNSKIEGSVIEISPWEIIFNLVVFIF